MSIKYLRFQALLLFLFTIFMYNRLDYSWAWFAIFFLAPDISMIGYLKNPRIGAYTYNTVHSYILPVTLLIIGITLDNTQAKTISLIWLAHNSFDRTLGFGLKLPSGFKDTNLGRIGN
jgi:hypothetical protein